MEMTPEDISRLKYAKDLLGNPGLAAKLTNVIGMPFEKAFDCLPAKRAGGIQTLPQESSRDMPLMLTITLLIIAKNPSRDSLCNKKGGFYVDTTITE